MKQLSVLLFTWERVHIINVQATEKTGVRLKANEWGKWLKLMKFHTYIFLNALICVVSRGLGG